MTKIAFAFTICTATERGKFAAKQITLGATVDYDRVKWWQFEPVVETSLEVMADRLRTLALQPKRMIVMGAPLAGLDLNGRHLRRWANAETATLTGPDRAWLPLDFDDVRVPKGLGCGQKLAEAALFVRDSLLPDEFRGVRMIAVPSASTGRRGDNIARLRLFAALDRPHPIRMMKDWTKGAASTLDLPIDSAIIQTGQPIYTGRPVFVRSVRTVEGQDRREGVEDPVPRALHAVILPGDRDAVALVIDRFAPKLAAIEAKVSHVARACGSNWRAFLDAAVGDDEGFFIPLTRGIGVAVREGAHTDEIEATVTTILAQRADPGRRARYGRSWVVSTIESFRLRDDATRAAHKRALSRLFIEETRAP